MIQSQNSGTRSSGREYKTGPGGDLRGISMGRGLAVQRGGSESVSQHPNKNPAVAIHTWNPSIVCGWWRQEP